LAGGFLTTIGDGIHDVHINSGTDPGDPQAGDDRVHQDGAIAFYVTMSSGGQQKSFASWVVIKFGTHHVVES